MRDRESITISSGQYGPELSEPHNLNAVLQAWLADAALIASYGMEREAGIIGAVVRDVEEAAEAYLRFISEKDAMLRSGHTDEWLRMRFEAWEREGNARKNPSNSRERQYRMFVVPPRSQ